MFYINSVLNWILKKSDTTKGGEECHRREDAVWL
jgi:hypothetical protein